MAIAANDESRLFLPLDIRGSLELLIRTSILWKNQVQVLLKWRSRSLCYGVHARTALTLHDPICITFFIAKILSIKAVSEDETPTNDDYVTRRSFFVFGPRGTW